MSHKGSSENDAIINDHDYLVNKLEIRWVYLSPINQSGVATVFIDFYVNVTKSIGQPDLLDVNDDIEDIFLAQQSHESVQYIKQYYDRSNC